MTSRLNSYKSLSPSQENSGNICINLPAPQNLTHVKLSNRLNTTHINSSEGNDNKQGYKVQFGKEKCKQRPQKQLSENINKKYHNTTHIDLSKRSAFSNIDLRSKNSKISSPS